MLPLSLRTVFSLPEYDIRIDGFSIDCKDIASMKIIRQSENMPVKGIVSSELIMTLRTTERFSPNAAVIIKVSGTADMEFCPHFISRISRRGNLVTIHAFDRMRMTEKDFRYENYSEEDQPFNTSQVLGAIAAQCGFKPCSLSFPSVDRLFYKDIYGKKCREILEFLAENGVGVWHCSDDEELRFTPFLSASGSVAADLSKSSPLYIHSEKGPFKAVYAKNTASGEVFSAGSGSDFRFILKLSGRLFDSDRAGSVMSLAAEKKWRSFYCAHAAVSMAPCGLSEFIFGDSFGFIAVRSVIHFCGSGVFAQAETADICEDESDYTDLVGYELRKRIEADRKYGCTILTDKGIGFTADPCTDIRKADISFFSALGDGITEFGGAMLSKLQPVGKIEDTADNVVSFLGTLGGKSFRWQCSEAEDGTITLSREEVLSDG